MRYYEILYIINPNFEKKKIDSAMKDINDRLKKTNSNIINHTIWGKKRLAYSMQGHKYGTYILLHFESGDSEKLDEFYSWLKLSTLVVRHMVVRLNNKPELIKNKTHINKKEIVKSMWSNYAKTFVEYMYLRRFMEQNNHIEIKGEEFLDNIIKKKNK